MKNPLLALLLASALTAASTIVCGAPLSASDAKIYLELSEDGDAQAIATLRQKAEKGEAIAQFSMGVLYDSGKGVPQSDTEAMNWYRKAADQWYVKAMINLGLMYETGQGVPQNHGEAVKWYRKAAEQTYDWGQYALGLMYAKGQGVPKNNGAAMNWYRKAALQGNAQAQASLGRMYEVGQGVPPNLVEALKWYRKAALLRNAQAQNSLGVMYETGQGVRQNYISARNWYRKAANQGDAKAQLNLGILYEIGRSVEKDYAEAAKWYRKAAKQGNVEAQNRLKSPIIVEALGIQDPPDAGAATLAVVASAAEVASIAVEAPTPEMLQASIKEALTAWGTAWTTRDVQSYLNAYATTYQPDSKTSHDKWASSRSARIAKEKNIKLGIIGVKYAVKDATHASTIFHQSYRSNLHRDEVQKTLEWENVDGRWVIVAETSTKR